MANYVEANSSKLDWAMPFQRTGAFPLDRSAMFGSYADAVKYAAGDTSDMDERGLAGTSYIGQLIAVFENDTVDVYKIDADRTLSAVGDKLVVDENSIEYGTDGSLQIKGMETAEVGQSLVIENIGTADEPVLAVKWATTSAADVAALKLTVGDEDSGLVKDVADNAAAIALKADQATTYTKDEIDGKLTGALHYKGTKDTLAAVIATADYTPTTGDVWNIATTATPQEVDAENHPIVAGDNVVYNGTGWDKQSGTIDLSAFAKTADMTTALAGKVDVEEGKDLVSDTDVARITKVEASTVNGKIKIEDVETTVYTLPTASTSVIGGVKSGATQDGVTVDENGFMTVNNISASKVQGSVTSAAKVDNTITIGEKVFDGSEAVVIAAEDIPVPTDVVRTSDIAASDAVGVVKSGTAQDGVAVDEDGLMTVNNISASKVQGSVASAAKVDHTITIGEKVFDGSETVEITAEDIPVPTNVVRKTDIATAEAVGVVKSSAAQDKVAVDATGVMTVNTISSSKVQGTVASAEDANKLVGVAGADILFSGTEGFDGKVKLAHKATMLENPVNINLNGDMTGTASFTGSENATITTTLANSGVTAGSYSKVTVNAKGLVTEGGTLAATDIPDITLAKVTDAGTMAAKSSVGEADFDTALDAAWDELNTKAHTHANKTVIDGITSAKVDAWDQAVTDSANFATKGTSLSHYGIEDAYTKTAIDNLLTATFKYMGTEDTFDAVLALDGVHRKGDVYNVATAGGTVHADHEGKSIKAGDNVVYRGTEGAEGATTANDWDVLSGVVDLTAYMPTTEIEAALLLKANVTTVTAISDKVDALETTVGDVDGGLVKDVATLKTTVGTSASGLVKAVADNTAAIGDADTGIIAAVAANTSAIAVLNGEGEDSVDGKIAAAKATIDEAIEAIPAATDAKIASHNTADDAHSALFAEKQNKAIVLHATIEPSQYEATAESFTAAKYVCTYTVPTTTLDATKDYSATAAPQAASCLTVSKCKFLPIVEMEGNVMKLYCDVVPTTNILIDCVFTEIQ